METREDAIDIIEMLYPADSKYPETAEIGRKLLERAKHDIEEWRAESTPVLLRYAYLCQEYEAKESSKAKGSYKY